MGILNFIVEMITAEFILTHLYWPNGGTVVALRAIWLTFWTALTYRLATSIGAPDYSALLTAVPDQSQILQLMAVFGSSYAIFYTRFAAQWRYLADLYNMIKNAECQKDHRKKVLARWKAAFMIDAYVLHMVRKPLFASVISNWADDERVIAEIERQDNREEYRRIIAAANACMSGV